MYNLCGNDQGTTGIMEMVFPNTGDKGKRLVIIVHHQKKGKKWVQYFFLNFFRK